MPATAPELSKIHSEDVTLALRVWSVSSGAPASAPPIQLLHYFGGSSREWEFLAPVLAGAGHACIAADARGHGDSSAADDYSVEAMRSDAVAITADRQLASESGGWLLLGHSMGGKVALDYAATQPAGLRGLILTAPSPPTPQPMSDEERQKTIDDYGDRQASEQSATKIAVEPLSDRARAIFVEDDLRTAKTAWLAWNESGTREDIAAAMPQIKVPALLIIGAKDPVIPRETYDNEVAARLPSLTRREIVPNAGHLVTMTNPSRVGKIIIDWIKQLDQTS